ncbi:hypothetical protein AVEN_147816-1 [Araneus ventricosus]|uniref:Uncharacterized protein n=1 Tax=Araneus ventricosus TaxID=182803 RepID=A0A4Y2CQY8_ARAVE|nr:hypothetical protein AVEN_147816-1 [Araneus ventricosus]
MSRCIQPQSAEALNQLALAPAVPPEEGDLLIKTEFRETYPEDILLPGSKRKCLETTRFLFRVHHIRT